MKKNIFISSILIASMLLSPLAAKSVTIGYQGIFNPWKVAIANGDFEKATGYDIDWRKFDSGSSVINAMASGDVQIALAGSSPIAAGVSRGVGIQLFWIGEDIAAAEALVVRNGSGINSPQDLVGKRIGVPFVSTTHFHLLFALEQFKISPKRVRILNMQPNVIASAWESGAIDAAFVWDPALGRIKESGKVLITSGQLSSWGKATFDGLVVNTKWGKANKKFMGKFVSTLAKTDASYRNNAMAWNANSKEVASIVKLVGGDKKMVPGVLALYKFLTLEEQASSAWLGDGKNGGAAQALKFTSEFLKKEKKIDTIQSDYGKFVNVSYIEDAIKMSQ